LGDLVRIQNNVTRFLSLGHEFVARALGCGETLTGASTGGDDGLLARVDGRVAWVGGNSEPTKALVTIKTLAPCDVRNTKVGAIGPLFTTGKLKGTAPFDGHRIDTAINERHRGKKRRKREKNPQKSTTLLHGARRSMPGARSVALPLLRART